MKVMLKNRVFHGGAPLSLLEYGKLIRDYGHDIVSAGEYRTIQAQYENEGIRTLDVPYFRERNIVQSLAALSRYIQILRKEKPDLILAIDVCNCVFHTVIQKLFSVPVIYIIPAGILPSYFAKIMKQQEVIVFSEENKEHLLNAGYSGNVHVITNRMSFDGRSPHHLAVYSDEAVNNELKLLLISRLDFTKIKSIDYVIDCAEKLSKKHRQVKLTIVGDGEYLDHVRKRADAINSECQRTVIEVEGFKSNVKEYILNSHIVFGKGRSIIEPIYYSRVSFVVNEQNEMWLCTPDSVPILKSTNFSGRGMRNPTAYEELERIIGELISNKHQYDYLIENSDYIEKTYDIKNAGPIIIEHINNNKKTNVSYKISPVSFIRGFNQLVNLFGSLFIELMNKAANKFFPKIGVVKGKATNKV